MLFSKSLQEITFADIDSFCRAWPEGVRVEYKESISSSRIPKVISSFANTVGGVWIIGVKSDAKKQLVFPIEGFQRGPGIEEQITQSAYHNLFPPLLPEIRIVDVPDRPGNVVVVIRVHESNEAPHAIENTTKVYIRTNNTTESIDLAEIDRIEYLLKRRSETELNREGMLTQLARHSRLGDKIRVRIGPQYPYKPLLTRDLLTQRLRSITDVRISPFVHPIREGYMAPVHMLQTLFWIAFISPQTFME